jgi:hypothetical protein
MKARRFSRQSTRSARLEGDTENIASKALRRLHARESAAVDERVREIEPTNTSHFASVFGSPKLTGRRMNSQEVIWLLR